MTPSRLSFALLVVALFALTTTAAPDAPVVVSAPQPIVPVTPVRADPPKADEADQILIDFITGPAGLNEKAFTKGEYKHVRAAFTKYFEARQGPAIKLELGDDAEPLFAWLDKNLEVKETLFTAIDPANEEPKKVMAVFRELWKADPEAVKKNDELATAVSVVWDNPRAAYDYRGHQIRTKSILPDGVMKIGAMENFRYVLDRQAKLKGPQQQLPWEFLVHVVNHRTP